MTDDEKPRFEAISKEWVRGFDEWFKTEAAGHNFDCELTFSMEYTDPPAHLLRGDGSTSVGWHLIIKDDYVEVGDGPLEGAMIATVRSYDPWASYAVRLSHEENLKWEAENNARLTAEGKNKATMNADKAKFEDARAKTHDIRFKARDGFWVPRTAQPRES